MPLIKVNSVIKGGALEEQINKDRAVVVYHWNSCGHCRVLMPILYRLMELNRALNEKANVFEVEYSNFNYIPNFLRNVNAFPYIVAYRKGSIVEEFNDQRTIPKLEAFISRNSSLVQQQPPLKSSSKSSSKSSLKSSSNQPLRKKRVLKSYKSSSH
jgi:thiol-disulfide isomerase/thioredoxin